MLWLGKTAGELLDERWAPTLGKLEIKRRETICIETAGYLPTLCGFSLLRLQFLEEIRLFSQLMLGVDSSPKSHSRAYNHRD